MEAIREKLAKLKIQGEDHAAQMEKVLHHNKDLEVRYNGALERIDCLDAKIHTLQNDNDLLFEQLTAAKDVIKNNELEKMKYMPNNNVSQLKETIDDLNARMQAIENLSRTKDVAIENLERSMYHKDKLLAEMEEKLDEAKRAAAKAEEDLKSTIALVNDLA